MKNKETIIQKEKQKLAKYEALNAKPEYKGYMLILLMVIALVHLIDSISTDIGGQLITPVVNEFFVNGMGLEYQKGLALLNTYGMFFIILNILAPFYKALCDKIGRRPLFIISLFGMAVGMLLSAWSPNLWGYLIGKAITIFFVASDIQVVYILEVAPTNKRGTMFSLTKFIGVFGIVCIPILRSIYLSEDSSNWRSVFTLPGIFALILAIIVVITVRESKVFLDSKISLLQTPFDERIAKKGKKEQSNEKSGILPALKYIFKDKQLKSIWFALLFFYFAMVPFYNYYEPIMTTAGMDTNTVTKALFVYPFVYAALTLMSGLIGDKMGRKKLEVIYVTLSFTGFIAFVITANSGVSPYIVGACFGLCIGAFWNAGDFISIMFAESAPTELRGSVMAVSGLTAMISGIVSGIITIIGMTLLNLSVVCGVIGAVAMGIALMILLFKVKETNGVDLETVGK